MHRIHEEQHSFGVIPLRKSQGVWEVFLIKQQKGRHWGFPKGRSEEGETPHDAARRELKEETGLEVDTFLPDLHFQEHYHFRRSNREISKCVDYFAAHVKGTVSLGLNEILEGKWVPLTEASSIITYREPRAICERLQEALK